MIALIWFVRAILASPFKSKSRLEAENAVLRHQLMVLRRKVRGRAQLTNNDRSSSRCINGFLRSWRSRRLTPIRGERHGKRTVKWFNGQKGYGFIQPDTGGKDVFVHISAVEKAGMDGLPDGAKITYDIISDRGKESAGNLLLK